MSDSVTNDPMATQSWWVGVLGSVAFLVVGIVSVFHINLNKDALTGLVPAAAFIASAVVAAVHVHSSAKVAVARMQARCALQDITVRNQQHAAGLAASPITDIEGFARKVAATVKEDLDRAATPLEPFVASLHTDLTHVENTARKAAESAVGDLDARLQQVEAWLAPKAQAAPAALDPQPQTLPASIPGGAPDSTSAPIVTPPKTNTQPAEYSAVPGAPVPTGPYTAAVPTVAPWAVA